MSKFAIWTIFVVSGEKKGSVEMNPLHSKPCCEEETSCVLEESTSLRALTGACATSADMDTSTADVATETTL